MEKLNKVVFFTCIPNSIWNLLLIKGNDFLIIILEFLFGISNGIIKFNFMVNVLLQT
jgi:hypothetical protein